MTQRSNQHDHAATPNFLGRSLARLAFTAAVAAGSVMPAMAATPQATVARITAIAPAQEYFILQATVPVPPRTVLDGQAFEALAIRQGDNELTTQVEIVSRYPNPTEGADVVELIARVQRPAGTAPGNGMAFDVIETSQNPYDHQATTAVATLLRTPGAVKLKARDLHGNNYSADLLARFRSDHPANRTLRDGAFIRERRSHAVMAPAAGSGTGASAPHPHLLGAHVIATTYRNEDFMSLDLVVHNGMAGRGATPLDDALYDVYFDELALEIPQGWQLAWAVDGPMYGSPSNIGGASRIPIVKALPHGQFHVVPQQSQFVRRFILARTQVALNRGRAVLNRDTRGFCAPGPAAGPDGQPSSLWSWWNPETARYQTSNSPLPRLDHIPLNGIVSQMNGILGERSTQFSTGSTGGYPVTYPTLGWAHPWGIQYGGMTGGDEIEMHPNIEKAWAAHPAGLRLMDLMSRAYIDRQPVALFDIDGRPPILEEHLQDAGTDNAHIDTYFYLRPSGSSDYFGLKNVDKSFSELAYATARVPYYEKTLKDFKPIDLQHHTRYLNPLLGLVWLANDSIAKLELELTASLFQFSFHQYYNSGYGNIQGQGLRSRIEMIADNPGQGARFGRGEAWGLIASAAHYAVTTPRERDRLYPWFALVAETMEAGQSACTGNTTAVLIYKEFKGAYQTRQSFEVAFILNAAESLRTTVFERADNGIAGRLERLLEQGALSTVMAPFWNPQAGGQHVIVGVRPRDNSLPEFCVNLPNDGIADVPYFDHTSAMPAWAYAYRSSNDGLFLQRSMEALGGSGNVLAELEARGLDQLYEFAPLLALFQSF